jgi:hypothetical protein
MRLLCPFCQKAITVPDSEAGKPVDCPECGQKFAAPQLYTPAPTPGPAPADKPGGALPVPETYVSGRKDRPAQVTELPDLPAPDRELSGYDRMWSFPIDPRVVRWIPPAALTLVFLLTFFSWDGMFPGGYSAYKLKADFDERVHSNWWLLPYFLCLIPALLLAWAGPIVELARVQLPDGLRKAWEFRTALLGALVVVSLLFLLAQWATGFGLQRAIREKVESELATKKADANTPEKVQRYEMRVAQERGRYNVRTTPWLRLSALAHLLAAAAVVAEIGLAMRGTKPAPRVGAMW